MARYKNIDKFNRLWKAGKINRPLTIFIGGAAGVGKSTLQKSVDKYIANTTLIATSTIRAILRTTIRKDQLPELYELTYKLWKNAPDAEQILRAYKKQCQPIIDSAIKLAEFAQVEMQHHSIEGSHFIPGATNDLQVPVFEVFLKVSNPSEHRRRLSGPTHQRKILEKDFQAARLIHDYIVSEAEKYNACVLESDQNLENQFYMQLDNYISALLK